MVCVHVRSHAHTHVCHGIQTFWSWFSPSTCISWWSNSGCQTWWQVSLPTEPLGQELQILLLQSPGTKVFSISLRKVIGYQALSCKRSPDLHNVLITKICLTSILMLKQGGEGWMSVWFFKSYKTVGRHPLLTIHRHLRWGKKWTGKSLEGKPSRKKMKIRELTSLYVPIGHSSMGYFHFKPNIVYQLIHYQ